jgi:ribonuclease Z
MSARELIVLGTASQVPTRTRNHNALFLQWDDLGILFDPGEGTQRQMIHAGLAATQITHIALTHFHGDHCLGLAGIVQRLSLDRVPHPVEVFYPQSGQVYFERLRHASIFYDGATIVPRPIGGATDEEIVAGRWGKVRLLARPLEHGVECYGYRLQEDDGRRMLPERLAEAGVAGPAVGELVRRGQVTVAGQTVRLEEVSAPRPGQAFAVTMDTRPCEGAMQLARGADLLVCEATYLNSEAQEAHEHYHTTAAQAAELARTAGVCRLVLTHFSQRYTDLEPFAQEAAVIHPDVTAAADLVRVPLPARRA